MKERSDDSAKQTPNWNFLKEWRQQLPGSPSLREMARRIGGQTNSSYLSQLESGYIPSPGIEKVIEICQAYEVPITTFLHNVTGLEINPSTITDEYARQIGLAALELSEVDKTKVLSYIDFLKQQSPQ